MTNVTNISTPFRTVSWEREQASQWSNEDLLDEVQRVRESLVEMQLAMDAQGWTELDGSLQSDLDSEVKRTNLDKYIKFAKMMYLMNPNIRRVIEVQKLYVWALGYTIRSANPDIKRVIDDFLEDPKNKPEYSLTALMDKECKLQYSGNIFYAVYVNKDLGTVRRRTIPTEQIRAIYCNPDDPLEPWFYLRTTGSSGYKQQSKWHPHWLFKPLRRTSVTPPRELFNEDYPVDWDMPIQHLRTGYTDGMKFGFPEVSSILSWAKAYRNFLDNWSKIMEAYARVAMQMSGNRKSDLPAARKKVASATTPQVIGDNRDNGSIAAFLNTSGGIELKAVKTAGQTTSAEEGRPILLQIASGAGIPVTFFGDTEIGNVATATTLDRPTELKMVARQSQWKQWLREDLDHVLRTSATVPSGYLYKLGYRVEVIRDNVEGVYHTVLRAPRSVKDTSYELDFPDILERNATERIRALVMGVTLMGKPATDVIPSQRDVTRLMLEALNIPGDSIEKLLAAWYPDDSTALPSEWNPKPAAPAAINPDEEAVEDGTN